MLNPNLLSLISGSPISASPAIGTSNPMMNSGLVGATTPVNNTNLLPASAFTANTMRSASVSPLATAETSDPLLALSNAAFNRSTNLSTSGAGSVFQGMTNPATGGSNPFVTPAPIVGINPNPSTLGDGKTNSTTLDGLGLEGLSSFLDQISSTLPQGTTATGSLPTGMMNASRPLGSNASSNTNPIFIVDPSVFKNLSAENTGAPLEENPPSVAKTESNQAVLTQLDDLQKSIDAFKPPIITGAKTTPTVTYASASTVTQLSKELTDLRASINASNTSKTNQESSTTQAKLQKLQETLEDIQAKSNSVANNTPDDSKIDTPNATTAKKPSTLKIPVAPNNKKTTNKDT
ncbi:MAG: hypothetical protein HEQ32_05065 [Vampirovibrio sp.]